MELAPVSRGQTIRLNIYWRELSHGYVWRKDILIPCWLQDHRLPMAVELVASWVLLRLVNGLCDLGGWREKAWYGLIDCLRILVLLHNPWKNFVLRVDHEGRLGLWAIQLIPPLMLESLLIALVDEVVPFSVRDLNAFCLWELQVNWLGHPALHLVLVKGLVSLCRLVLSYGLPKGPVRQGMVESPLLRLINGGHVRQMVWKVLCVWAVYHSFPLGVICFPQHIVVPHFWY